ncbi:hypothetical protein [uncultured Modestobacter sp.]|uniref:hypothetical protein n=1 Tax=uncultured Modestobacter sp. TaxID=380048 RepID=UPI002614B02C|nr:hypothetical protein [uncultured Modestobacter sp.]
MSLTSGVLTALWYASPDLVPSRTARAWAKAGLLTVSAAMAVRQLQDLEPATGTAPSLSTGPVTGTGTDPVTGAEPAGEPGPSLSETLRALPLRRKAVAGGVVTVALAASVAGTVAAERRAHRRGEARAAAGKRLPHTGPALVYGALMAGLGMLPSPAEH